MPAAHNETLDGSVAVRELNFVLHDPCGAANRFRDERGVVR
ncbi:hypothetical protein [Candidatus Palauibacter sp.]